MATRNGTPIHALLLAAAILATASSSADAQFDSGSDGSDGALLVDSDTTLALPQDGRFHFTTVTVEAGATLSFEANALDLPVVLLATGDVVLRGTLDVSGQPGGFDPVLAEPGLGGPGGFDGGWGGTTPGAGQGPGGGAGGLNDFCTGSPRAGAGSHATSRGGASDGTTYGSELLVPLTGGSGGGGATFDGSLSRSGGGGGGALLVASSTSITLEDPGRILAAGGTGGGPCNGGSGGAVRLVAPAISGDGSIDVSGGGFGGGDGRIRLDTIDLAGADLSYDGSTTIGALLLVEQALPPSLRIAELAGTAISENETMAVEVFLPAGSPTTQPVTVRGTGFVGTVPVTIAVVPRVGLRTETIVELDFDAGDPAEATAMVELAPNTVNHVQAWVR